jgi:hypothetical protein
MTSLMPFSPPEVVQLRQSSESVIDVVYVYVGPCMSMDDVDSWDLSVCMNVRLDVNVFMDDFYMLTEMRLE